MHIDLTLEEMRYILETVGAGDSTKPVVASILHKMGTACRNYAHPIPEEIDSQHVRDMAYKWKQPI